MKYFFAIILLIIWASELSAAEGTAVFPRQPFWSKKKSTYKRVIDQRAILISVKSQSLGKNHSKANKQLKILGVGVVGRPRVLVLERFQKYSLWSQIDERIQAAKWSKANQRLFLHMSAYGYEAKMILKVTVEKKKFSDWVYMRVVRGSFQGMRIAFRFMDAKSRRAEVALSVEYDYQKLPMPDFFLEFGLEVVFQKIAEKMRSFIENDKVFLKVKLPSAKRQLSN